MFTHDEGCSDRASLRAAADGLCMQAVLVAAAVAAVRASAALERWVTQVHAERCVPAVLAQRPSPEPGRVFCVCAYA